MILATDVKYDEQEGTALVAGVLFENWGDEKPVRTYTVTVDSIEEYVSGEFYRRELPCMIALVEAVEEVIDLIVVDSYVDLGDDHPGMGRYLFNHLNGAVPVVGVAKSRFHAAKGIEILRGESTKPLHVTSAGCDLLDSAESVRAMHGEFRMPTLLKLADALTRGNA